MVKSEPPYSTSLIKTNLQTFNTFQREKDQYRLVHLGLRSYFCSFWLHCDVCQEHQLEEDIFAVDDTSAADVCHDQFDHCQTSRKDHCWQDMRLRNCHFHHQQFQIRKIFKQNPKHPPYYMTLGLIDPSYNWNWSHASLLYVPYTNSCL